MNDEIDFNIGEITGIIVNTVKTENKYMINSTDIFRTIKILNGKLTNLEQVNKNQTKRNSRQRLANQKQYELILKLQQENQTLQENNQSMQEEMTRTWQKCDDLQQENERLKQVMLVKQYYSETLPEGTEFVLLTKENYDRQQKDIQLELINYKSRCEKAIEYINTFKNDIRGIDEIVLLNILQNGSDEE